MCGSASAWTGKKACDWSTKVPQHPVEQALLAIGLHAVRPTGSRTHNKDIVRLGKLMLVRHDNMTAGQKACKAVSCYCCLAVFCRSSVQRAQQQWRAFMAEAPPYPENDMGGRGIVILSGMLPYMVPAWVNIHMLRLTGGGFLVHAY